MPGETELHRTLKREACRWLYRVGYRAVAAEVALRPLGIVDAIGAGVFKPYANHHGSRSDIHQTCVVECKASRADFLRDLTHDGQMTLCMIDRKHNRARRTSRRRVLRQTTGLGKFAACLLQPFANLHYVLAPPGVVKKTDVPPRWGLLSFGPGGISVVVRATWQETSAASVVECAIAQRLTNDIHRADERAIISINRTMLQEQEALAARIRKLRPFTPAPLPGHLFADIDVHAACDAPTAPVEPRAVL